MKSERLSFRCLSCREDLVSHRYASEEGRVTSAELACPSCGGATPVIQGFPLFSETSSGLRGREKLDSLAGTLFKPRSAVAEFIYQQSRRPVFDAYAAYYPFNEALVGFMRFAGLVREIMRPGDRILDLSCRTGWTGELLAALFPQQYVVSLWDGNQGVLAYSGYAYWLAESGRADNLEVVFLPERRRLPFPEGHFGLVFGYDFLHHHVDEVVLEELVRVAGAGAPLVFPHVHTNHSVPEPYFEREGRLISAGDWCEMLSALSGKGARRPCVMSELEIYAPGPFEITTAEHIEHYNCCVLLAPESWMGRTVDAPVPAPLSGGEYFFINPLVEIDPSSGVVSIDRGSMDGGVAHLLERHPAIERDLRGTIEPPLGRLQRQLLYWIDKGLDHAQLSRRLGREAASLDAEIRELIDRRLILALPVSRAMWLLQHYYRHRQPVHAFEEHRFHSLWMSLESRYAGHPVMVNHDGSEFNVENTRLLVEAVRALLSSRGVGRGDHLLIIAAGHLEVLITCWAAWLDGIVAAVLDPQTTSDRVGDLIRELGVRLAFVEPGVEEPGEAGCEAIVFDDMSSDESREGSFSERIEPFIGRTGGGEAPVDQDSPALVLCTSGSSGTPKRVRLSQGSLFRSGGILARHYGWDRGERLLSLGPMYSMSGLRNPATAALQAGATIVVASANQRAIALNALGAVEQHSVNIVTAVPAFLENLERLIEQGRAPGLPSLRLLLTTASRIDGSAQRRVAAALDIEIADYYGLTETGGVCILQDPGREYTDGSIGIPADCLCEIRAPDDNPLGLGETGQLHIYSANLMLGYVGRPETGLMMHDGWLATGDRARFLQGGDVLLLERLDGARKNRKGEFIAESFEQRNIV